MINNVFNCKIKWIIVLVLFVTILGFIFYNSATVHNNKNRDYRVDAKPLSDRFGEMLNANNIKACFWKADIFGKPGIGPSSYWMKGFIILDSELLMKLQAEYSFEKAEPMFDEEINPEITGCVDCEWCYNKELSHELTGESFGGKFYLDIHNGILYFDVENR